MMSKQAQKPLGSGLYIVSTPIGNAADISLRALEVLQQADVVACEDTRTTGKLLSMHHVKAGKLTAYHEHNAARVRPELIRRLKNGETVALASDAGTPLVSDPGFKLVQACREADVPVTAVPGASAVLAALVVSGLPTDRFFFAGFLPNKQAARKREIETLAAVPASLVIMESPRRLAAALGDLAAVLGAREAAVARELTKFYEEVRRGTLAELARHYRDADTPKGEVTVVIAPPEDAAAPDAQELDDRIRDALATSSLRDAVQHVCKQTGVARRTVYARALEIEKESGGNRA